MRIVIVSGIYPPDIGGPASHSFDLDAELTARGHAVMVLTLCDGWRGSRRASPIRYPRRWPWPARYAALVLWLVRHRREYDIVYSAGLALISVIGARLAHRPVVVRLAGDPVWERASRRGMTSLPFDEFNAAKTGPPSLRGMRLGRNWAVRRADALVTPSQTLQTAVQGWSRRSDVHVVANGVRPPRRAERPTPKHGTLAAVFVGRLVPVKQVDILIQAVSRTEGATLSIVGDGPERQRLEALRRACDDPGRIVFRGAVTHAEVLDEVMAADVLVLASSHEGMPHAAIDALVCGVPVVTSDAGGVTEAITDGENGVVLDVADVDAFTARLVELRDQPELRRLLSAGAAESAPLWHFSRTADRVEDILAAVLSRRPAAVFVGKTRMDDPLSTTSRRKLDLDSRYLELAYVVTGPPGVQNLEGVKLIRLPGLRPRFLGGILFYAIAPSIALALSARRHRAAVVCQSAYEGLGVVLLSRLIPRRWRPPIQIEVHGDWRSAPRLYRSRNRRVVAPLADRLCPWALRRADQVRTVGDAMTALVRDAGYVGPIDCYCAHSEYDAFTADEPTPLPENQSVLFVGVFQPYKAVDVLLEAWTSVIEAEPLARLDLVGTGPRREELIHLAERAGLTGSVRFLDPMSPQRLSRLMDLSYCLVLPSRSEGLGRVNLEAMARGRPIVATAVGGIPELVVHGKTGLLVAPDDSQGLAQALVKLLRDRELAQRMGTEGYRRYCAKQPAKEYADGVARLAEWARERAES